MSKIKNKLIIIQLKLFVSFSRKGTLLETYQLHHLSANLNHVVVFAANFDFFDFVGSSHLNNSFHKN